MTQSRTPVHPLVTPATESLFPGFLVLALALAGAAHVIRRGTAGERRVAVAYGALLGFAFWASLGPAGGLYSLLMKVVPAIGLLRAPSRLGLLVMCALVVFAGFGVRALSRNRAWIPVALVPLMAIEFASLPWSGGCRLCAPARSRCARPPPPNALKVTSWRVWSRAGSAASPTPRPASPA